MNDLYRYINAIRVVSTFLICIAMLLSYISFSPQLPLAAADGGDFSLDFAAAAPYSYTHSTGGGAYNDGTNAETADIRPELEGGDFSCGYTYRYVGS